MRDDSGIPLGDAVVVTVPGGYTAVTRADGGYALCVISETLYSVTAYRSNHDKQMKEVQVAPLQTIYLDFTLKALSPVPMDTDGDGLSDDVEKTIGTDPTKQDTDGDGLSDYNEVNYDGDPTAYTPGADLNPLDIDTDKDGFVDGYDGKVLIQDYPAGKDMNQDGYVDGEMASGTSPLSAASCPCDGDLNGDGVTDLGDVLLAQRMAMGLLTPTLSDMVRGDTAPLAKIDGDLNGADVLVIYRKTMQ